MKGYEEVYCGVAICGVGQFVVFKHVSDGGVLCIDKKTSGEVVSKECKVLMQGWDVVKRIVELCLVVFVGWQ